LSRAAKRNLALLAKGLRAYLESRKNETDRSLEFVEILKLYAQKVTGQHITFAKVLSTRNLTLLLSRAILERSDSQDRISLGAF